MNSVQKDPILNGYHSHQVFWLIYFVAFSFKKNRNAVVYVCDDRFNSHVKIKKIFKIQKAFFVLKILLLFCHLVNFRETPSSILTDVLVHVLFIKVYKFSWGVGTLHCFGSFHWFNFNNVKSKSSISDFPFSELKYNIFMALINSFKKNE